MITDLNQIRLLGKKHRDQNFNFRSYLKMQDSAKIDKIVHELNKEYSAKIDCTQCGNCCSEMNVNVHKNDIQNLSKHIGITQDEFIKSYTAKDEDGELCFNQLPCNFLKDKKCAVYELRPQGCIDFPNLHKKNFNSRTLGVIQNYSICPIVFNVFEDLKKRLNFR